MSRKTLGIFVLLAIFAAMLPGYGGAMEFVSNNVPSLIVAADPGHGGMDGGAQAADGTREDDLNLAIAKALREEAKSYGISVILTRETEKGLYEEENMSGRWSKLGDMRQRKKIIGESGADLMISIHLNNFTRDLSVRGAQVFYPKEGDEKLWAANEELAGKMQEALNKEINQEKPRKAMAKEGLYLLKDAGVPSLLIECGFLSNEEEAAQLKEEMHRKKIAQTIVKTIAEKYGLKGRNRQNTEIVEGKLSI